MTDTERRAAEARVIARYHQSTHKHAVKHERCEIEFCNICQGGLFVCADCGAAEIEAEQCSCTERQLRAGLEAAIRAADLALFVIRKQGVMPNSSWQRGFDADLAKAKTAFQNTKEGT